ncbi:MAG: PDZ domain-containing protein [Actinobacteria bacterium]|nr:MAG: PDZ domain-containing protein [Actinomycetota bacterium]
MSRPNLTSIAALAVAGLLGGGAALGGVAIFGDLGKKTSTTVVQTVAQGTPAASSTGRLSINEIYRRSAPGVVQIVSTGKSVQEADPFFGTPFSTPGTQALGSGFVLDKEGHIVTNYHVVQGAEKIQVGFSNNASYRAKLVGSDPSTDLAVLKVSAPGRALTPLPLGDSDRVQVGDEVVAIGNPFGLDRTATAGIISAIQRRITAPNGFSIDHALQTDAAINHGNSGGPLIDATGSVVGVNSQIETGTNGDSGNVGIAFAIPANTVKDVVAQILKNGRVQHAYLGVSLQDISASIARALHLPISSGILIESVQPSTGAAKAGLKGGTVRTTIAGEDYMMGGDIIVGAAGKAVGTTEELRDLIAARKPGDKITLEIYRGTKKLTVTVTLGRQPSAPPG